jgi:hypothetical protein
MRSVIEMIFASIVILSEVAGVPRVKIHLPAQVRLGDRLPLHFRVKRTNAGRSEVLEVNGDFRVTALSYEPGTFRQILEVETATTGKVPSWRAVKRTPEFRRVIPPAKSPREVVV